MNKTSEPPETVPSANERSLAAFAHISIILGPMTNYVGGLIVALIIWVTQREKSAFVAAQALQALAYQMLMFGITIAAWMLWGVIYMLSFLPWIVAPETDAAPITFWFGLGSIIFPCGISILAVLIGLWAGVRAFQGHDFRYPLLGNWIATKL